MTSALKKTEENARLHGVTAHVVEDEWLIALAIEDALETAGARVVGTAGSPDDGLAILDAGPPDVAVLDFNLDGTDSTQLWQAYRQRGVPTLILSSRPRDLLPEGMRDCPYLGKPADDDAIVGAIVELLNI